MDPKNPLMVFRKMGFHTCTFFRNHMVFFTVTVTDRRSTSDRKTGGAEVVLGGQLVHHLLAQALRRGAADPHFAPSRVTQLDRPKPVKTDHPTDTVALFWAGGDLPCDRCKMVLQPSWVCIYIYITWREQTCLQFV